jgi:hypothetical protein
MLVGESRSKLAELTPDLARVGEGQRRPMLFQQPDQGQQLRPPRRRQFIEKLSHRAAGFILVELDGPASSHYVMEYTMNGNLNRPWRARVALTDDDIQKLPEGNRRRVLTFRRIREIAEERAALGA